MLVPLSIVKVRCARGHLCRLARTGRPLGRLDHKIGAKVARAALAPSAVDAAVLNLAEGHAGASTDVLGRLRRARLAGRERRLRTLQPAPTGSQRSRHSWRRLRLSLVYLPPPSAPPPSLRPPSPSFSPLTLHSTLE
eukprot:scaffold259694_cov30-Tisochrysis_lutea.AAC.1